MTIESHHDVISPCHQQDLSQTNYTVNTMPKITQTTDKTEQKEHSCSNRSFTEVATGDGFKISEQKESKVASPPAIKRTAIAPDSLAGNLHVPKQTSQQNYKKRRKMSGRGILAEKSLFLKDEFQRAHLLLGNEFIEGMVSGLPNKTTHGWTIKWYNESLSPAVPVHCYRTHVPKESSALKGKLFEARDRYDKMHPDSNKKSHVQRCPQTLARVGKRIAQNAKMKLKSLTTRLSVHLLASKCLQELQDAMKPDLMCPIAAKKS